MPIICKAFHWIVKLLCFGILCRLVLLIVPVLHSFRKILVTALITCMFSF